MQNLFTTGGAWLLNLFTTVVVWLITAFLVVLLALIILSPAGFGAQELLIARMQRQNAALPLTPVSALGSLVGTGKLVRVQGTPKGPFLKTPNGVTLVMETVNLTRPANGSENTGSRATDYAAWAPTSFALADASGEVLVDPQSADEDFLDMHSAELTSDALPPAISGWVDQHVFTDIYPNSEDTAMVATLAVGKPVTVCGMVTRRNGDLVLQSRSGSDDTLIVTDRPYAQITSEVNKSSRNALMHGVLGCLIEVPVLVILFRWFRKDRKSKVIQVK